MGRATVADLGLGNLWRHSGKGVPENSKAEIGVLAFEVARLMSKVINLWQCLSEKQLCSLRKEIVDSIGVKKLVSNDENYLMDLALNEIMENFVLVGRSVAVLGRKCTDLLFSRFERFVNDPIKNHREWRGWDFRLKKMEKKVKKMERFVGVTIQMAQELEVLAELEQTFKKMQANPNIDGRKLQDFQQRVICQRQAVRSLREMSPWIRSYDYIVRLLGRSLLTILERIKLVHEIKSSNNQRPSAEHKSEHKHIQPDYLLRSHSCSAFMLSSIHSSEKNVVYGLSRGPIGKSIAMAGSTAEKCKFKKLQHHHQLPFLYGKLAHSKTKQLAPVGAFTGCVVSGNKSPIPQSWEAPAGCSMRYLGDSLKPVDKTDGLHLGSPSSSSRIYCKLAIFNLKRRMFGAPPSTLGDSALAFHYANLIVFIGKLASSPQLIDSETRDDLYNMLPTTIRMSLRTRLKLYAESLAPSVYNASLVTEWSVALSRMLEWLSPLAHNTIRWLAERNFERKEEDFKANVLLVQTLHFADQTKTEAVIVELLVGLNYIYRIKAEGASKRPRRQLSRSRPPCLGLLGKKDDGLLQQSHLPFGMKFKPCKNPEPVGINRPCFHG